jgi:chemotaxis protein CheX
MKLNVDDLVKNAVVDVFGQAFGLSMVPEESGTLVLNGEPHVAGAVGFIGDMTGVVYIYCSTRLARKFAAKTLGVDESSPEADEMINDSVGEIANMVVGAVKAKLFEQGVSAVLTIPSIVRGSSFVIECVSNTERAVCLFRTPDNHQVVTEVLLKPADK